MHTFWTRSRILAGCVLLGCISLGIFAWLNVRVVDAARPEDPGPKQQKQGGGIIIIRW